MRVERTGEIVLPLSKLPIAEERVEKLARRAKRLGLAEPKLIVHGACAWRVLVNEITRQKRVVEGVVLSIEGERPVLPGHTLLGTVEPVVAPHDPRIVPGTVAARIDNGLRRNPIEYLVFAAPAAQEREGLDLGQYAGNGCDHCKTKRNRKLLVLVEREDGVVVRVGRECVQSYLPGVSVEALVESVEYARALDAIGDDDGESFGGGRADSTIYVRSYLTTCFNVVRVEGGYKPAALQENSTRSTVDEVLFARWKHDPKRAAFVAKYAEEQSDRDLADAAIEWASKLEPKSDFERNIGIAARAEYLPARRAGLVAAIVPGFNKELVKRSEKAERVSEHVGAVGKREVFENLLVKVAYPIETDFGSATIYVFEDEKGRSLKWKASGRATLEKGWRYTLKGTVKKHDEYKGTAQTVLSRCVVVESFEPAEAKAAREMREQVSA